MEIYYKPLQKARGCCCLVEKLAEYLDSGQWLQAKREAERLLALEGGDAQEAQILRMGAEACLQMREFYNGVQMLERANEHARRAQDWREVGRAGYLLSGAYLWLGDYPQAEQVMTRWLREVPNYPEQRRHKAGIYKNMGILSNHRHQNVAALTYYSMAEELFQDVGDWQGVIHCVLNQAWIHLMENRPNEAGICLDVAALNLQRTPDLDDQAHYTCMRALHYRLLGDFAASGALCQEILNRVPGATEHHMAEAAWIAGCNALDQGQVDEARSWADQSIACASRVRYPLLMRLAWELQGKVSARNTQVQGETTT